jgi:hypothetical protein
MSPSQSSPLVPMHSHAGDCHPPGGDRWAPPLLFGRRPPQSNCPPGTVPAPAGRLEAKGAQSGISPFPPQCPQALDLWVPPILRSTPLDTMPSCSEAPRGLFVQSRVVRIFTHTAISPGPSSRQRPDRYTIRAGRNLPDKEFRYLRTVIVTAAVHRGFGSGRLKALPLTFRHWAGVSPYTSAYAFCRDLCFC